MFSVSGLSHVVAPSKERRGSIGTTLVCNKEDAHEMTREVL